MSNSEGFIIENGVLKKYTGDEENIVIPEGVTEIGVDAFELCTGIVSVKIPEGVTTLKKGAFRSCSNLTAIDIPESVTYVGDSMFLGCVSLSSVKFPDSVTSIGSDTFMWCWGLEAFTIPASVTSIDGYAFGYCKNLTTVTIPESVRSISKNAFKDCQSLRCVVLPRNITAFKGSVLEFLWDTFNNSEHKACIVVSFFTQLYDLVLRDVNLKSKIKANKKIIVDYAIEKDDAETLENLFALFKTIKLDELNDYIEKAASTINVKPFLFDYKNKKYSIKKQNKHETDKQDKELGFKKRTISDWKKIYTFVIDGETVTITGYKGTEADVVVPEKIDKYNVVAINDYAFSPQAPGLRKEVKEKRYSIESVIIPDSVKSIGEYVFKNCDKLTDVIIPEGIESIGVGGFYECHSLKSITIPDSVKAIGDSAFCYCYNLTSVKMPEAIERIGKKEFYYCSSLESITIPDSVKSIESDAFAYCQKLTDIVIPNGVESIGYGVFDWCRNLTSITIPGSVTRMGSWQKMGTSEKLTIHTPAGSYAQEYAKENNIPFVGE